MLRSIKPKSAYWHFNTSLIHDRHSGEVSKAFWDEFKVSKSSFVSLQQWWDISKIQIQQLGKQYILKNITRDITRALKTLEKELAEIQDLVYTTRNHDHTANQSVLADFLVTKVQGALVRSRFLIVSQTDVLVNSFFFFV